MPDNLEDFLEDDIPAKTQFAIPSNTFNPRVSSILKDFIDKPDDRELPFEPQLIPFGEEAQTRKVEDGEAPPKKDILGLTGEKFRDQGLKTSIAGGIDRELKIPLKIDTIEGETEREVAPTITPEGRDAHLPLEKYSPPDDALNFFNNVVKSMGQSGVDVLQSGFTGLDIAFKTTLDIFDPEHEFQLGGLAEGVGGELGLTSMQNAIEKYIPTQDDHSFLSTTVPNAIGSILFFMYGGMILRGVGLGAGVAGSLLGAGSTSQSMYETAKLSGASDEHIIVNYLAGLGLGVTEGIMGIGKVIGQVGKRTGRSFTRSFMTGAREEFIQEEFQNFGQNLTVQNTYDLSVGLLDNALESGVIAIFSGGMVNVGMTAIERLAKDPDISNEDRDLLDQAKRNFEGTIQKFINNTRTNQTQNKFISDTGETIYVGRDKDNKKIYIDENGNPVKGATDENVRSITDVKREQRPETNQFVTEGGETIYLATNKEGKKVYLDANGIEIRGIDKDKIKPVQKRTGQQNTEFFTAKSKDPSSTIPYEPTIEMGVDDKIKQSFNVFSGGGNFTGHISKMIPTFFEKQLAVVNAIIKGKYKNFLDIGTSEGGTVKTVARNSKTKSVGIDPNAQMKENFNSTPDVQGAEFRQEAFQNSWTDPDGTVIKEFKTDKKFDIINEDFTFQFVNNDRETQVSGVKKLLTPDGVFVTSEKFRTRNNSRNEQKKLEHQRKYFNEDQLTEDHQGIVSGMQQDMVSDEAYYQTLKDNFKFVEEFWNAGNFKGYIASDNQAELTKFKENVGDLSSEFTDKNSTTQSDGTTRPQSDVQYTDAMLERIIDTHNVNGGSSFDTKGSITSGFAVGTQQGTTKTITGRSISKEHIRDFISNNQRALSEPNAFIGTWFNPKDGNTHLDVSISVNSKEEAMRLGSQNKQVAIHDIQNDEDIQVGAPTTSITDLISGKWDEAVGNSKKRLNEGYYGSQLLDVTTVPAVGMRFVSDVGMIMADKMIKEGKKSLGTPKEFAVRLLNEFGEQYPAVRRFAREIFEYANSIMTSMRNNPLSSEENLFGESGETIENVMQSIDTHLRAGETGEYIPTGKGAIILGGDIADFEGDRRKHIGSDFGKDQALKALRKEKSFSIQVIPKAEGKVTNISLKSGKGSITAVEKDFDNSIQIKGSGVAEDIKGKGVGSQLYDAMIDYAIASGYKTIESDASISDEARNQYMRLKSQGFEVIQSDEVTIDVITKSDGTKKTYYRTKGDKGVFTVKLPDQPIRRRGESYPVWATAQGVAKQISQSATITGNDTLIFMVYPKAWNGIKDNYSFQENLHNFLVEQVGEDNVPKLPNYEAWQMGAVQSVREPYIDKIKTVIKELRKSQVGEDKKQLGFDALAYKWGIENGVNLTGKIKGVAKFKNINQDLRKEGGRDERIDPHRLYDTEIEGYNYQELDEPIDFNYVQQETEGTDVGNQGKIQRMTGAEKELYRKNQVWRNIHQRGQTVTKGQSELIDALIMYSEGDRVALNQWLQQNPDSKGEIVDPEAQDKWEKDNRKTSEQFRNEANKSLSEFLKPADSKRTDTGITLMGGIPFFNPEFWRSLGVVGKAIARGSKGFSSWAQKMVQEFGDWIKPALRSLYSYINQIPSRIIRKVGKKELDYATSNEEIKSNPVVEGEVNKTRATPKGTLPSSTKGYNMSREHPKLSGIMLPAIDAMRKEFDVRRRGTITNEELLETAKRNAESLTDVDVWDIKKSNVRNAEDILALRLFITDKMLKVADDLKALKSEDGVIRIKDMSDQLVEVMRMWQVVRGVGTELGRAVQSFSIPMSDEIIDSFMNAVDVINEIDPQDKMGGGVIKEMMEDMAKLKTDTPQKKQTVWEWTRYIFLNWILQNPLTDMANIGGNLSNISFHIFANTDEFIRERSLLKGIRMGIREGRQSALKVLHGEQEAISKFTEGSQIEMPSAKKRSWKNYFKLIVPTTRLGIEDAFFRSMAKNIETQRMVKKTGRELGVAPDDVFNAVSEIINDPEIAKFERKEYRDLVKYLEQIEDQLVFQQELGTIGKGFSKISRVAFPIIPFVTTPTNILRAGYGASPMGFTKLFKKDLGKEERAQIIRKALAGSVVLSGMASLIAQGLIEITGNGSDDAFERDLMEKMGYKPNHLYINTPFGKWGGSYMNVNPMNTVFSIMGDMFDKYRFKKFSKDPESDLQWYNKVAQDLGTALLAMGRSVTEQSYLRGVREMMDAFSGRNPDWFMRMLTGYARVGAIQGIQRITGTEDRGRYVTRGRADEQIQKNFPLTSNEGLIESVSAFGQQRQSQFERFPFPFTKVEDKTAYSWMEQEGLTLTIPSRGTKLENRQMNRKEYEMFARGVGTIMDETVQKLWQQQTDPELPENKKLSLEKLQDKLDAVYSKARDAVKQQIKEAIFKQIKEGLK